MIHRSEKLKETFASFKSIAKDKKFCVHPDWLAACEEQGVRVSERSFPHMYKPGKALAFAAPSATAPVAVRGVARPPLGRSASLGQVVEADVDLPPPINFAAQRRPLSPIAPPAPAPPASSSQRARKIVEVAHPSSETEAMPSPQQPPIPRSVAMTKAGGSSSSTASGGPTARDDADTSGDLSNAAPDVLDAFLAQMQDRVNAEPQPMARRRPQPVRPRSLCRADAAAPAQQRQGPRGAVVRSAARLPPRPAPRRAPRRRPVADARSARGGVVPHRLGQRGHRPPQQAQGRRGAGPPRLFVLALACSARCLTRLSRGCPLTSLICTPATLHCPSL